MGIEEDAFKIFVSGGELFLRRNRDAETHFEERPMCGGRLGP